MSQKQVGTQALLGETIVDVEKFWEDLTFDIAVGHRITTASGKQVHIGYLFGEVCHVVNQQLHRICPSSMFENEGITN